MDYDFAGNLDSSGHVYVPESLGSHRANVYQEGGRLVLELRPSRGPHVKRLYMLPKMHRRHLFKHGTTMMVLFRRHGDILRGSLPLPGTEDTDD
jgi:hypothetical protein